MNLALLKKQIARLKAGGTPGIRGLDRHLSFNAVGLTTSHRAGFTLYPGPNKTQPFVVAENPSTHAITPTLAIDHYLDFTGIPSSRYMVGQMIRQYVACSDVPAGAMEIIGSWVIQANNIDDSGKLRMTAGQFHCEVEHPVLGAVGARGSAAIGSGWAYTEANTNVVTGVFAYAGVGHQWSNCKTGAAVVAEVSNTGSAHGTADEVMGLEVRTNFRGSNDVVNGAISVGRYRGIAFTQPSQFGTEAPEFGTFIGIHFEDSWDHLAMGAVDEAWLFKSDSYLPSYFRGKFSFDNTVVAPAQASWWSATNTWTYGSVTLPSGCDSEGTLTVHVYDPASNLVATATVNSFGNYTSSPFYLNGVWNDADTFLIGKKVSGAIRHIDIIGGTGWEFNFTPQNIYCY